LQVLGSRADGLKNLERYPEAASDAERVLRAATARYGGGSFFAVASRVDLARVQCRAGLFEQGLANARAAHAAALRSFGSAAALTHGTSHGVGDCLVMAGRYAEARPWLSGLDEKAVGELVGNRDWGRHVDLLLAEADAADGRLDAAKAHLDRARPAFAAYQTDAFEARRLARLARKLGVDP
jgi:tetratricopeptide (TPR) repeat protein